jgi:hypothetical protein
VLRLPAVTAALARARAAARRFPLALASAGLAAGAAMSLVEGPERPWKVRLLATAVLGLPAFAGLAVAAERRGLTGPRRWLPPLLLLPVLALFGVAAMEWTDRLLAFRMLQLLPAALLLAVVLPFPGDRDQRPLWQFGRHLATAVVVGGVYAHVLGLGLALALAALDNLLGVPVPDEAYGHLAVLLAFGFLPWFVLARTPADHAALDQDDSYPAGLKVFAQFVLIPLVVTYLVILTAYLGRVLVTRAWPSGWIGWLVSGVSAAGVLALVLVHPVRGRPDSRWVDRYGRWFFAALLPSLGMLVVAVGKRIGQYGLTEPRYVLLVLALWMGALAVYYAATGARGIRVIPASLGVLAALTAFGPWGAHALSARSQVARLDALLRANGMGAAGAATRAAAPVPALDRREMSAVLSYLREARGPDAMARALGVPPDSLAAWQAYAGREAVPAEEAAMRWLGLEYLAGWEADEPGSRFLLGGPDAGPVDVAGFERLAAVRLVPGGELVTGVD